MTTTTFTTMTHKIKITHSVLDDGNIIMHFAEAAWGPIVTGATLEEVKEKFIEALKVSLITKALMSIKDVTTKSNTYYKDIRDMAMKKPMINESEEFVEFN